MTSRSARLRRILLVAGGLLGSSVVAAEPAGLEPDLLLEVARHAALEDPVLRDFPEAERAALLVPPLAVREVRLAEGRPGVEYQWLGNGKGGGWFVHVRVDRASGTASVDVGYGEE